MQEHPYVGAWVTADGDVRHELLPDGRYRETRGRRQGGRRGRYEICRGHINYWDDAGSIASGVFVTSNELHRAEEVLYRDGSGAPA